SVLMDNKYILLNNKIRGRAIAFQWNKYVVFIWNNYVYYYDTINDEYSEVESNFENYKHIPYLIGDYLYVLNNYDYRCCYITRFNLKNYDEDTFLLPCKGYIINCNDTKIFEMD